MFVVVSNLAIEKVEEQVLSTFTPTSPCCKRFVDDASMALLADLVTPFHNHLHNINEHIQFTVEMVQIEKDGTHPFQLSTHVL